MTTLKHMQSQDCSIQNRQSKIKNWSQACSALANSQVFRTVWNIGFYASFLRISKVLTSGSPWKN